MDLGFKSPLIDFFRRGEVAREVRLVAAQGAFAPRAHEQLALLMLLSADPDEEIAATAGTTLNALPAAALKSFLALADTPQQVREFFAARGVTVDEAHAAGSTEPLAGACADAGDDAAKDGDDDDDPDTQLLSTLPIIDRMKLAMKGTRSQRATLIRDSNKLVAAAVLSSPKLTEAEVEAFAKMANVSEDVLRIIASNRAWTKNYAVISALSRNPKTPLAISMHMVQRLNERDIKALSIDRNVPEGVRLAARKFVVKGQK